MNTRKLKQYIECSLAAVQVAGQELQKQAEARQQVEEAVPEVVEVLLQKDLIEPHEKQAAQDALRDHATALELLRRLAERPCAQMGEATKQASQEYPDPERTPFAVLERYKPTKADEVFLRHLGLGVS